MEKTFKRRLLTKNQLVISLSGAKAGATQIINYEQIREVRMDLEKLEVNVLMTYDDSYIRVFDIDKSKIKEEELPKHRGLVLKFYNDLITATMMLSKEEVEKIKEQTENIKKKMEEAKKKAESNQTTQVNKEG